VRDYQAQVRWWEPFAIKVPVTDMKQQNRIRLNDFASLATVAENGAYANLAWGDADWRTLYLTASTSLYRLRLSVPGIPVGPH